MDGAEYDRREDSWVVTALAAAIAALMVVTTAGAADSAPQEAAGAAMALAIAEIQYVFTCCLEGITHKS
jgi:hypothetical protein